jgi:hypothetical protein
VRGTQFGYVWLRIRKRKEYEERKSLEERVRPNQKDSVCIFSIFVPLYKCVLIWRPQSLLKQLRFLVLQIEALQACFYAHSSVVDEQIHVPDIFMPLNCHFCFSVTSSYPVLCAFSFPCNLHRSTSRSIEGCSLKEV